MTVRKCRAKNPDSCPYHGKDTIESFFGVVALPKDKVNKEASISVSNGSWSTPGSILFKTLHGSGLYGLSHENSDKDFLRSQPLNRECKK